MGHFYLHPFIHHLFLGSLAMPSSTFSFKSHFPFSKQIVFALNTLVCLLFFIPGANAQGDLFINPKRIVFENQKRSVEVSLANTGNDSARYAISFVQIRMKATGEFEQITVPDSGQYFADQNLRIFPRTVILGPKETQVVKVQTYQKENLAPGEYRSHLYFRAVPKQKLAGDKAVKVDSGQLAIRLTAVFGITIPVIIRVGESDMQVSISDLKLVDVKNAAPVISMRIHRSGNMSAYGDITVDHLSPSGKATRVGFVKGLSVYTPNPARNVNVPLINYKITDFSTGQFQITYSGTNNGKPVKFTTALLNL